jgi:signal transduction histidine kinase
MSSKAPGGDADLRRSAAYLAEVERLTQTGSFAIDVATREMTHSSPEHSRLYGFDPARGLPALGDFLERIHPDDRGRCLDALETGIRDRADIELEYRVVVPQRPPRIHRAVAHTLLGASGEPAEVVGTIADVTEQRRAGEELQRLVAEQAALRSVATLIAKDAPPSAVFAKVAEEVATVLGGVETSVWKDEGDGTATVVAVTGIGIGIGTRMTTDGDGVIATVLRERRPRRIDDNAGRRGAIVQRGRALGVRSAIGCPVIVGGRLWGALGAARVHGEPFAPGTEMQLAQFADLVATAIANAQARAEVRRLADEQAALRRVATLVARGAQPADVFSAVTREVARLFAAMDPSLVPSIIRFDAGPEFVLVGAAKPMYGLPLGSRWTEKDLYVSTRVWRTGRSARVDGDEVASATGPDAELLRRQGFLYQVGSPILVEGSPWGAMTMNAAGPLPPDTGERLESFTELVATAIANAEGRSELLASRARLVAAADEARRRFERDLHDGVQQRLVSIALDLGGAEAVAPRELPELAGRLASVRAGLAGTLDDLRELSRGIHPAILTEGGLGPALKALARRSPVPVQLELAVGERLADRVEVGAYYIVSEALTNAAKHARASRIDVTADVDAGLLRMTVRDDGVGGADPARGTGLTGLSDRVAALGGTVAVTSPPDGGTSLRVELPAARAPRGDGTGPPAAARQARRARTSSRPSGPERSAWSGGAPAAPRCCGI